MPASDYIIPNYTASPTLQQTTITYHGISLIESAIIIIGFIALWAYYYMIKDKPSQKRYVTKSGKVIDRTQLVRWVARGYTIAIILFYAVYYAYLLSAGYTFSG